MRILDKVKFKRQYIGCLGLEQEFFLTKQKNGELIAKPKAMIFLDKINSLSWTYELSACQVEFRTLPHENVDNLINELKRNIILGRSIASDIECDLACVEVMKEVGFPIVHYPNSRYNRIVKFLSNEQLSAAMRVAGIHVHYGCESSIHALGVYNALCERLQEFIQIGDHSQGERLRLYGLVAGDIIPPKYNSLCEFENTALFDGFDKNLSNCWHLIRMTKHGTVEVRAFGNTDYIYEIFNFVSMVKNIGDSV